jgi:hypothetical protein
MLLISRLKQYQFTLPEIAAMIAKNDPRDPAGRIKAKQKEIAAEINCREYILRQMEADLQKINT